LDDFMAGFASRTPSREAWRALPKIQKEALAFVKLYPGATQGELAGLCGNRDSRHLGRRLPELVFKGFVRKGKLRRCTNSHRLASTWWPV
jgi:hypothetical protein